MFADNDPTCGNQHEPYGHTWRVEFTNPEYDIEYVEAGSEEDAVEAVGDFGIAEVTLACEEG